MAKITSIINQKGGVGKTTTTCALAAGLARKGMKVLLVDFEPQTDSSFSFGIKKAKQNIDDVLEGRADISDVIVKTAEGIDIIPGSYNLVSADVKIKDINILNKALNSVRDNYDFIIIDTPPMLGILTINALVASDSIIIPAEAETFALRGIGNLYSTLVPIIDKYNPDLKIDGILPTKYRRVLLIHNSLRKSTEAIAERLNTRVFSPIREGGKISEAQNKQKSIFDYAWRSNVAQDYWTFVNEYLEGDKE